MQTHLSMYQVLPTENEKKNNNSEIFGFLMVWNKKIQVYRVNIVN